MEGWVLIAIESLLAGLWLVLGGLYLAGSRQVRMLSEVLSRFESGGHRSGPDGAGSAPGVGIARPLPPLSVVITARDEAPAIETTVRHALAQRYPGIEIIVVDDRSSDGTGAILDGLVAATGGSSAALSVIHVRDLPAGWIGKCHACHVGSLRARGEWLLFTDADVTLLAPDLLERVVAWAEARRLDHVGVFPDLRPVGAAQAALLFCFEQAMLLAGHFWEMDRDRPRGGAGVGAFNLVRRSAYERTGGHDRLRMEVAEDYALGRLLKASGGRQRLLSGLGLVRCPWHRGARAVVRGLEKNLFAGVGYSVRAVVWQTLLAVLMQFGPIALALASGGVVGWGAVALQAAVIAAAAAAASRRLSTHPVLLWALEPAACVALVFAVWNSMLTTIRAGGVRWRGTFYPLDALRRGALRSGSGRRPGH
jgi:hypothetical protein